MERIVTPGLVDEAPALRVADRPPAHEPKHIGRQDGARAREFLFLPIGDTHMRMTFGYLRHTMTQSNRVFVTIECLYGCKVAFADGIRRIVKP